MEDNQILKNLRCCADKYCKGCSEQGKAYCKETVCAFAWDLMYRQRQDIERLQKESESKEQAYNNEFNLRKELKAKVECLENKLFALENDFEKTENLNEALGNDVDIKLNHIYDLEEKVERLTKTLDIIAGKIKLEFYREFDELIPSIMSDKIDEIVKECRGDEND